MARLVAVSHPEQFKLSRRQLPLQVEGCSTLVVQFIDTCNNCKMKIKQDEFNKFVEKYNLLTPNEILCVLNVSCKQISNSLQQIMPCVGCRRCVENLFNQLVATGHMALEPLIFRDSSLTISNLLLSDPKELFNLFYNHGSNVNSFINSIPIGRKNKRCALHCLDSHKTKSLGIWYDAWTLMETECKEEITVLDYSSLSNTLDDYLRKHKFCTDCKSKVQKALKLLVQRDTVDAEKCGGFNMSLYEGITSCTESHIHVKCDENLVQNLIARAESELKSCYLSSNRERHAKTWDVAQEEVLTAIGIHLFDRLYRVWQRLKVEEQAWHILFHLGLDLLRKGFELALEEKQGNVDEKLISEKIQCEKNKEIKREKKKQKRKKRKENTDPCSNVINSTNDQNEDENILVEEKDRASFKKCSNNNKSSFCNGEENIFFKSSISDIKLSCCNKDNSEQICDNSSALVNQKNFVDNSMSNKSCISNYNNSSKSFSNNSSGCSKISDNSQSSQNNIKYSDKKCEFITVECKTLQQKETITNNKFNHNSNFTENVNYFCTSNNLNKFKKNCCSITTDNTKASCCSNNEQNKQNCNSNNNNEKDQNNSESYHKDNSNFSCCRDFYANNQCLNNCSSLSNEHSTPIKENCNNNSKSLDYLNCSGKFGQKSEHVEISKIGNCKKLEGFTIMKAENMHALDEFYDCKYYPFESLKEENCLSSNYFDESSQPSTDSQTEDDSYLNCNNNCNFDCCLQSLEDMLKSCSSQEEHSDCQIPEEEIVRYEANRQALNSKRFELRQRLQRNFDNYVDCNKSSTNPATCIKMHKELHRKFELKKLNSWSKLTGSDKSLNSLSPLSELESLTNGNAVKSFSGSSILENKERIVNSNSHNLNNKIMGFI